MKSKLFGHLSTIFYHKKLVMRHCFKVGLYKQGILHDMSKFSPTEFIPGVKYYEGTRSPNGGEREDLGFSCAWMHHKGRNKHHFEYWTDYIYPKSGMCGVDMPNKYVAEMICDRIAASKTYNRENYDNAMPYAYFLRSNQYYIMNDNTRKLLRDVLFMLKDKGEEETFAYIKRELVKKK